jgi:hydrogenase-4 component E
MSASLYSELISVCAGTLLLLSVMMVWRGSLRASIRLLAYQGVVLAALVAVVDINRGDPDWIIVTALVLGLKGIALPWVLGHPGAFRRTPAAPPTRSRPADGPRLNPISALVLAAVFTTAAYALFSPLVERSSIVSAHVAPAGIAMVLIGFLILATRRRARAQLVGFLVLDNGIATVAFLISGGVPLLMEFGASLDVLLVVLILQVFTRRMGLRFGGTNVDKLRELHD